MRIELHIALGVGLSNVPATWCFADEKANKVNRVTVLGVTGVPLLKCVEASLYPSLAASCLLWNPRIVAC